MHNVVAQLFERRCIRELVQAFVAPGVEHPQLAGFHLRCKAGAVGGGHQLPAEHRQHQVGTAFVGHMLQLDAGFLRNQLGRQVRAGQRAGRAIGELAGIGLGIGDEVGPGFERAVGRHHDAKSVAGDVQHIGDVLDRVPVDFGGVTQTENAQRDLRQGIAVGRCALQLLRGQGAAGTGFVFDDDRLAKNLRGVIGQRPHGDIGRPASGKSDDQLDGANRKALGLRQPQSRQGGQRQCGGRLQ